MKTPLSLLPTSVTAPMITTGLRECPGYEKVHGMEDFVHGRGGHRLAIAVLAVAAVFPSPAGPGWAEGVNIAPAPGGLADHALPPPAGLTTPEPLRAFTDARGRTCRVYERRVMIEGAPSTALATICREPSGRWVLSR